MHHNSTAHIHVGGSRYVVVRSYSLRHACLISTVLVMYFYLYIYFYSSRHSDMHDLFSRMKLVCACLTRYQYNNASNIDQGIKALSADEWWARAGSWVTCMWLKLPGFIFRTSKSCTHACPMVWYILSVGCMVLIDRTQWKLLSG